MIDKRLCGRRRILELKAAHDLKRLRFRLLGRRGPSYSSDQEHLRLPARMMIARGLGFPFEDKVIRTTWERPSATGGAHQRTPPRGLRNSTAGRST